MKPPSYPLARLIASLREPPVFGISLCVCTSIFFLDIGFLVVGWVVHGSAASQIYIPTHVSIPISFFFSGIRVAS